MPPKGKNCIKFTPVPQPRLWSTPAQAAPTARNSPPVEKFNSEVSAAINYTLVGIQKIGFDVARSSHPRHMESVEVVLDELATSPEVKTAVRNHFLRKVPAAAPKAITPSPAPPAVASPSPALSYASLEGTILKRPHSPGSNSSGSSRAASIMEVDDIGEFGSRAPTPTPATQKRDILSVSPPQVADISLLLPPPRADILSPAAVSAIAAAARPAMPLPHVDTPMSHVPSQPEPSIPATPLSPITSDQWVGFLDSVEVAVDRASEIPSSLVVRLLDLVVKLQLATARARAPPKKKVRVAPPSPLNSKSAHPAPATTPAATGAPAPKKAVAAPPALSLRPYPKAAPPVSVKATPKRRQGKHTAHGASRRGIILTPLAGSTVTAASFTPEIINSLNLKLEKDLKSKVILTHAVDGHGIFIATTCVLNLAETAFVLKHIQCLFPSPAGASINSTAASSTSYLWVMDVPILKPDPMTKDWVTPTHAAFMAALKVSPVGSAITNVLKHTPRLMRTSAHSNSCIAWIDINDTVAGSNARRFISQFVSVGGVNCRIAGAKPHSGSVLCTRCQRWGHHSTQCRRLGVRCPHCGRPHTEANHQHLVDAVRVDQRTCVNCVATKRTKHSHSATDCVCPFWKNRFDRAWLKHQFKAPSDAIKARSGPSV